MNLKIYPSALHGSITPPASKSVAHRVLIANALSHNKAKITGNLQGEDVDATKSCLNQIFKSKSYFECFKNLKFNQNGNIENKINKTIKNSEQRIELDCNESGSTLRFLLPIVCALGLKSKFIGRGRLKQRPIKELTDVLSTHGALVNDKLPIYTDGKLKPGDYHIDGNISSQFITGLLFALPLLDGDSKIIVSKEIVSESYLEISLNVLNDFDIKIDRKDNMFFIKGNQKYIASKVYNIESDWSSASILAVAGALCGNIALENMNLNSFQGDKIIVELLKDAKANVDFEQNKIIFSKSNLQAINFSAKDCPDIVPIMAVCLASANGISNIYDVDRLKMKESDRLKATMEMLDRLGIENEYKNNNLKIVGGKFKANIFESYNDHRMAMSSIVASLNSNDKCLVNNVECIKKSYPQFIDDIKTLGGKIES